MGFCYLSYLQDDLETDVALGRKLRAIPAMIAASFMLSDLEGTSAAATTLLKTLIDPGTPPSVKVRAAEAIFNHAAKAIEIEDIEARVAALEQAASSSTLRR
ncbi:MAG TPA: hypothetical protein VIX89_06640 [Bryobacteraceae bacterium]